MITKNENPIYLVSNEQKLEPIVLLYLEFNHLKQLYRQGWLKREIPKEKCESVADHSFGVAILGFFIACEFFPELSIEKIITMSLLHETGEIYGGDITPSDNISKEKKHEIEKSSVIKVLSKLNNSKKYINIWEEYESKNSKESIFVTEIDKLEMAIQAAIYQNIEKINLEEFFPYVMERLSIDKLKEIFKQINMFK